VCTYLRGKRREKRVLKKIPFTEDIVQRNINPRCLSGMWKLMTLSILQNVNTIVI